MTTPYARSEMNTMVLGRGGAQGRGGVLLPRPASLIPPKVVSFPRFMRSCRLLSPSRSALPLSSYLFFPLIVVSHC